MRIAHVVFSRNLGGLEQVFVDYCEALAQEGHEVIAIVHPQAGILPMLKALPTPLTIKTLDNKGLWDVLSRWRLRKMLRELKPDIAVAQGNRAISLLKTAAKNICPRVAVNHGYNIKRAIGFEAVIAINEDMKERYHAAGQPLHTIHKIFNMIKMDKGFTPTHPAWRNPPVIGAIGRFVEKKGFGVFVDALAGLETRGVDFRAILAGDGELAPALKHQAQERGIAPKIDFCGWVKDKKHFFDAIDIFCFSSLDDVCPIVLLEAYMYGKPIVMTDCKGPVEIATRNQDALVVPKGDAAALADALAQLIQNPQESRRLGDNAFQKLASQFTMDVMGKRLSEALQAIQRGYSHDRPSV